MIMLIVCALLLAALCVCWIATQIDQAAKLTPEPVRVRHTVQRRR